MLIDSENCSLLIIDFQEKLASVMDSQRIQEVTLNTSKLIKGFTYFNIPILYTQQYTKGLGETVAELKNLLPFPHIEKTSFSCFREPSFVEALKIMKRRHIVLCGMESHICVLQTALDLLDNNYSVTIVSDATISRSFKNHEEAMNFLSTKGANILPYESILFMLLRDAKNLLFKEISKLVK
jgi:nicotinamidase-related amidase